MWAGEWTVACFSGGGGDGSWAAASGQLSCTGVVAVTGAPNGGYGSILLVDDVYYQDVRLTCDATLGSGCDNAGLVFGYLDADNYWVKVYSDTDDTIYIYEINGGTWTQRSSTAYTITDDSPFTMDAEVRAGAADTYAGTVPSGQVGLWCSDSSDNDFDDFKVRDIVGPFALDTGACRMAAPIALQSAGVAGRPSIDSAAAQVYAEGLDRTSSAPII